MASAQPERVQTRVRVVDRFEAGMGGSWAISGTVLRSIFCTPLLWVSSSGTRLLATASIQCPWVLRLTHSSSPWRRVTPVAVLVAVRSQLLQPSAGSSS